MAGPNYSWATMSGDFAIEPEVIRFKGTLVKYPPSDESGPAVGLAICDQPFGGGSISAKVTFSGPSTRAACFLILYYDPATRAFVGAGLGNEALYGITAFKDKWIPYIIAGDPNRVEGGRSYCVECRVRGSLADLFVDNVKVITTTLPAPLPRSQVGIWCRDAAEISVREFSVVPEPPRAFVVMQFTSPYNELYHEVVHPICEAMDVHAVRADETYGPGMIIADVAKQIDESKFVIAEITPPNPNVYYEVGYSHARGKPTILIADRKVEKLPFDVSPFRTLFYENSIEGKRRVEEGLRRHIKEVLGLPDGGTI